MENFDSGLYIDRLAYARSLLDGAGRIAFTAKDEPISTIGIPFYLLIGFSIENSLKAFLDYKKYPHGSWLRSHDLADLTDRSLENDLRLSPLWMQRRLREGLTRGMDHFVASRATPLPILRAKGMQLQIPSSTSATHSAWGMERDTPALRAMIAGYLVNEPC
jgi:hypothetical protein